MSILSTIKDDVVAVEHFISSIVTAILPVVTLVNPQLAGEAKLAVDVLNALALNTSDVTTQTAISTSIAAITSNPDIAAGVLRRMNLSGVANVASDVKIAAKAVADVESVVTGASVTQQVTTETINVEVPPSAAPQPVGSYGGGDN